MPDPLPHPLKLHIQHLSPPLNHLQHRNTILTLVCASLQVNGSEVVGTVYGAYTSTVYAAAGDISGLVLYNLSQAYASMGTAVKVACDSAQGLSRVYTYAGILGSKASPPH